MNLGAQGLEWGETPFWVDPGSARRTCVSGNQFPRSNRQGIGAHVCHPVVLHGSLCLDVLDVRHGQLLARVLAHGIKRRRGEWPVHPRLGWSVRNARWAGD